jgi:hypothetical protein
MTEIRCECRICRWNKNGICSAAMVEIKDYVECHNTVECVTFERTEVDRMRGN